MKQKAKVLSLLLVVIMVMIYTVPIASILHAASLSDYKAVASFAEKNFPIIESSSQGVSFTKGSQCLSVTTKDATDPYFTIDLPDTSLSGKVIAIKYKGDLLCKIANDWLYPDTSAGGWGAGGAGVIDSAKIVCDGLWNLTTFNVSKELIGSDLKNPGTSAQTTATIKSFRLGGVKTVGKSIDIAFIGVFDSTAQAKEYNDLFCSTYTTVDTGRIDIVPSTRSSVDNEFYDFQDSAVTNGLTVHNNKTNLNATWTTLPGTGASTYVVDGTNKYLRLCYDSIKHDWMYAHDCAYVFSADVRPEDLASHFAGFIFNYGYENDFVNNAFFESNKVDKENSVALSGVSLNIFPAMIEICVMAYDETNSALMQIKYTHMLSAKINDSFHKIKVIDNADGIMRFFLDDNLFATIKYDDPGLLPGSAENYNERYYRNARIYDADGELQVSTTSALIAYAKSVGIGSRARVLNIDNLSIAPASDTVKPTFILNKTIFTEDENITATINYGDCIVNDLYLGIYNEGEECGSGMGKVSASNKIELVAKTVKLPKLMAGSYYAVIMSGNTQYSDKVSFTVTDVAASSDVYAKDTEISVGETVKVPIMLGNNPGLKDLAVKVSWDPAAFKPVSAANGIVMGNATFSAEKATASYTLTWKGTTKSTATGDLAYVELETNGLTPLGENIISIEIITGDVTAGKGSVKVKDTGLKFKGASLVLSSDLTIRYLVNKSEFDNAGYSEPRMKVFNGGEEKIIEAYEATSGSTVNYVFEYKDIAPQMMNDELSTVLLAKKNGKEVSGSVLKYGVKNYVYSMLDKTTDPTFRTMLVDLLNYGAAAQKYAEYNTGSLVNAELTQVQALWGTKPLRNLNSVIEIVGAADTDAAVWKSMALKLENKVEIVGKFAAENTDGIYVLVTDDNGNVYGQITSDEFFASQTSSGEEVVGFYFDKLNSTQMSEKLNFVVYNSEGQAISGTCVYSVESYIQKAQSSAEGSLKTLTETIIKYGDAAKKYVEAQGTMFGTKELVDIGTNFYANIQAGGKYLTLSGNNVVLGSSTSSQRDIWKFIRLENGAYRIINSSTGNALDVDSAKEENFANVQTYACNGTKAQQWWIYLHNGYYVFRPAHTDSYVLDVYAGNFENGTNVDIYSVNYHDSQMFTIENRLDENTGSPTNALDKTKTYRVLFIGNSFTDTNKMSVNIFPPIVQSGGYTAHIHSVTRGSWTLQSFANSSDTYGAKVDEQLANYKFDYVILQEQSHRPITAPDSFYAGVRALDKKIKANGAKTILYATWGYCAGHGQLPGLGGSTTKMEAFLRNSYKNIAGEIGAEIAHVGKAFSYVYTNHPSINLYLTDLYHPSQAGSTLAAYVIFSTIFNEDPRTVANNGTTDANTAAILKDVAYRVALGDLQE